MNNPSATVDIVERDGSKPTYKISALTTAGFSMAGEVTRETADSLVQRIRLACAFVDESAKMEELPDLATMPEKHMQFYTVYELKDGRIAEDTDDYFIGDPKDYMVDNPEMLVNLMKKIKENGFAFLFPPSRMIMPSGEEVVSETTKLLMRNTIAMITTRVEIRDLESAEEISEALEHRQRYELQAAARQAEAEELAKGVPVNPIVPESDEAFEVLHIATLEGDPRLGEVNDTPTLDIPISVTDGRRKLLRINPPMAHALAHILIDGDGVVEVGGHDH